MSRYECQVCGWVYDSSDGDPKSNIASGTKFEDLPGNYICPECGAKKGDFIVE